jgi:hypothetical protein
MPFQSKRQRRFMFARHPEIAKRWANEYPNQKNLPEKKHSMNRQHYKTKKK